MVGGGIVRVGVVYHDRMDFHAIRVQVHHVVMRGDGDWRRGMTVWQPRRHQHRQRLERHDEHQGDQQPFTKLRGGQVDGVLGKLF